ncbi:alpha/beta fold hydrolase [Blastococcus goldschmidtiae]|uniref:Alpha/beta hydrolase n=1 Tax=Blastococcus goldschmidtiae TaxID=3075546 RepID=A0ABU2K686_9ACTN|nr:alpha/beta hydrolase [Blastococcus sp. DSM 46792]MDT0275690.1 alpha/beta hydrolase [Blastococcus sp. DSM 46792]
MTEYVQAPDGTRIAVDRAGAGQPLILIGGAGQFRAVDPDTRELTGELARRGFTVLHHDRPGRGDSAGDPPFGLAREVAAVSALIDAVGGRAWLYGSSSGGAIALAAAAELPGVERLFLWEVPLGPECGTDGAEHLAAVRALVAAGDREGIWRLYTDGMPPEWFEDMRSGPGGRRRGAGPRRADRHPRQWAPLAGSRPRRPAGRPPPGRGQRRSCWASLELIPGIAPARKASTKCRKSSWVRRA